MSANRRSGLSDGAVILVVDTDRLLAIQRKTEIVKGFGCRLVVTYPQW